MSIDINSDICFCYHFKAGNENIYLTDNESNIIFDHIQYQPATLTKKILKNNNGQDFLILDILRSHYINSLINNITEVKFFGYNKLSGSIELLYNLFITNIELHQSYYSLRLEPISIKLEKPLLKCYSETCRAGFGDDACMLDSSIYSKIFTIYSIHCNIVILSDYDGPYDYYDNGILIIKGLKFKIIAHKQTKITLEREISFDLVNERATLIAGCDKKFTTCADKFNNAINFQGEPNIPGKRILNI